MSGAGPHRCTILVIDDDSTMREVICVALEASGYRVIVSANGRDALQQLRSQPETCLILLDLSLPVMDGHAFREAQQRDRSLAWIPVIVISGLAGVQWEAERLDAAAVIWKPVDLDELRSTVARIPCVRATLGHEQRATPLPPDQRPD